MQRGVIKNISYYPREINGLSQNEISLTESSWKLVYCKSKLSTDLEDVAEVIYQICGKTKDLNLEQLRKLESQPRRSNRKLFEFPEKQQIDKTQELPNSILKFFRMQLNEFPDQNGPAEVLTR